MGDAEDILQTSRKRAAGREISRDNPGLDDDEETCEEEVKTFTKASAEVLASRRIVKVRRSQTTAASSAPSSNPFAGMKLVPPPDSSGPDVITKESESNSGQIHAREDACREIDKNDGADIRQSEAVAVEFRADTTADEIKHGGEDEPSQPEAIDDKYTEAGKARDGGDSIAEPENVEEEIKKDDEVQTAENAEEEKNRNEKSEKSGEGASLSSFQQLSSSQNAFTGLAGTGLSGSSFSFGPIAKDGDRNAPLFGSSAVSTSSKIEGTALSSMQQVSLETGEENEKSVFVAESVLYEFLDGTWKERGKGELKVNVSTTGTGKARLIMRARGNYRLIMNASVYPEMKLTNMDKKGVTFACLNSAEEGKDGLSTFAVKFKDVSMVDKFNSCVMELKDKISVAPSKTPENSPSS